MTSAEEFERDSTAFRRHLFDLNQPRFQIGKTQDAYTYVEAFEETKFPPWIYNLTKAWEKLYAEPYKGVTVDGNVKPDLFQRQDEGVPIQDIKQAAEQFLSQITPEQRKAVSYPINAKEWRAWSNPEFLLRPFGIRLEEASEDVRAAILRIFETALSPAGYQKAVNAMRVNHFLGEIVELLKIMNQYSYNFLLFGEPSATESWGFTLYGHHLCLAVFLRGPQIVIAPTFTGAEPNIIDSGPWKGTEILHTEGRLGLQLMQSLTPDQQARAQIYKLLKDPAMQQTGDLITDRWNKDDQRHVCGAHRDNRIVPYEGSPVSEFTAKQKSLVLDIAEQFLLYHPDRSRALKKQLLEKHFDETYFCWIGSYGDEDPFYFRVQSPVVIFEFDHHSGVFLSNTEPAKFHTHTIVRFPNQGDYGMALREENEKI